MKSAKSAVCTGFEEMFGFGRVLAVSGCALAIVAVAGCSSGTKRTVERTTIQPTAYAANASVANTAQSMTGRWYLNDEFERDCYINLSAEAIDAVRRVARATGECSGAMVHVGGWAVYDAQNEIRFYDKTGRVIGQLQRGEPNTYKGTLHLTTGDTVVATLRQI